MALTWSMRRQLLYYAVGAVLMSVLLFVAWQTFFTKLPTCRDGIQNGSEQGIDCGGSCTLLCEDLADPPKLVWTRAFPATPQRYTAVALVENSNIGAGARQVRYSFRIFDDKNSLVVERQGFADIPPLQSVPVIETNIDVGNRNVARTLFEFTSLPVWVRVPASSLPHVRIMDQNLAADGTRLSAMIFNEALTDVEDLAVAAVVFDQGGIARAASKTIIERIPRQSSVPIVFTWSAGFEGVARAEITILPSF